jgi:hypothetical protein
MFLETMKQAAIHDLQKIWWSNINFSNEVVSVVVSSYYMSLQV